MRTLLLMLAGIGVSFAVNYTIAAAVWRVVRVPRTFPPFTALPMLSGSVAGVLLAFVAYGLVRLVAQRPERAFLFLAIGVLAVSFALPIRLSFTKSQRFAGVTPAAQMVLTVMHAVVAASAVVSALAREA